MPVKILALLSTLLGAAVLMGNPEPAGQAPAAQDAAPADQPAEPAGEKSEASPPVDPAKDEADEPNEKVEEPFSFGREIKRLGNEKYKVRTTAQDALLKWGNRNLDEGIEALYEVYRTSDDPEVRLRSRQVLRRLVIVKQPFDGQGYLGIQMDTHRVMDANGELQPAVLITMVREGTAAEVAKLQANDLITGVDDVVFNDLLPTRMFSDYIKSKRPGDEIVLHVRRGEQSLDLTASLRRRSPLLDQVTQWGTQLELPPQEQLDEADFQDWLRTREAGAKRD